MSTERDEQRAAEVVRAGDLQAQGYTVRAIAAELGVSRGTAANRLAEYANAEEVLHLLDRAEGRAASTQRLEQYIGWLAERKRAGIPPETLVPILLRVEERLARLGGWDAPSRIAVDTPRGSVDPRLLGAIRDAQRRNDQTVIDGEGDDDGPGE